MTQTKTNTNEKETKMTTSLKRIARIAGVLYLLVAIFGGFALGFVYPKIYVAGDAAKTAGNVLANSGLVRLGVVADLFQATVWVFVAITLYLLLKHVNKSVASAMVVLTAIGASITCLNTVFEFEALRVATGAVNLATFGAAGSNALVLLLVDAQHYGVFIAQIFFGLWLAPMGYLAYKSRVVPQGVGRPARRGVRLLPRGHARGVPGPRLRPKYPYLRHHPVSNRGDLDGRIPARDWREGPKAREADPRRGCDAGG